MVFSGNAADYHIVQIVGGTLQITDLTTGAQTQAIGVEHLLFADTDVFLQPPPAGMLWGTALADALAGTSGAETLLGQAGDDTLSGGGGNDTLDGGSGADRLTGGAGANTLLGGQGDDVIRGGKGADALAGAGGADHFVYVSLAESGPAAADSIQGFVAGQDVIDLSAIDAIKGGGNDAFTFIGGAAFSAAGQLRYDATIGTLEADVTGDGLADLRIALDPGLTLQAQDFVL
jgi:Ca2+-binding RTX toxin-like protein